MATRGVPQVPIAAVLRGYFDEHVLELGYSDGLVFGLSAYSPFTATAARQRAAVGGRVSP
jgi:hypothetical protein